MFDFISIALAVLLGGATLFLRIRPHLSAPIGGADCWFYLIYVRELRKKKTFPPTFSYFLLDHPEQWYPPGFPLLLAIFPEALLQRWHWLISPVIDTLQALLLYGFGLWYTQSLPVAAVSVLLYAVVPSLYSENRNLNSRALGALLFTLNLLALFFFIQEPSGTIALLVLLSGMLVFLTHKMATQALVFVYFVLSLVLVHLMLPVLLVAAVVMTIILSGGFYRKVFRAHMDILAFWRRHIGEVRAHQVFDSPLYGESHPTSERLYVPGWRGIMRSAARIVAHNPLLAAFPVIWFGGGDPFFIGWYLAILVLIGATTFIPSLRFLGEGFKYMKYLVFPQSLLLAGSLWAPDTPLWGRIVIGGAAIGSIGTLIYLHIYTRNTSVGKGSSVDPSLADLLDVIRNLPGETLLCLPTPLAEVVAYQTGKKVLWGGHGYGFDNLEGFFPMLTKPVEQWMADHQIDYFLLDQNFAKLSDFKLPPGSFETVASRGAYILCVRNRHSLDAGQAGNLG